MRAGLGTERPKAVYGKLAHRCDFQHALLTLRPDQRGRMLLAQRAVREG